MHPSTTRRTGSPRGAHRFGSTSGFERYLESLERSSIKLGLERIRELLERCGNPQKRLSCIHVAGTNGKGSVCALVESILRAAGFHTGLFTSPHLVSYRERIRIGGRKVSEELLLECAGDLASRAEAMTPDSAGSPSYFEFTTALAFSCFSRENVDYAVVEVGLGGRLDATNVVDAPVAVITSIDLEHQAQLGESLSSIAAEKAAIIKEGARVVCGPVGRKAIEVIRRVCREKRATLLQAGDDIIWDILTLSPQGSRLRLRGACGPYDDLFLPFAGRHQAANCAIALGVVEALRERGASILGREVRRGIAAARWPGRLQLLCADPLLLADCAHNPAGARAVAESVAEMYPGRQWMVVLGILKDKDVRGICGALAPVAASMVVTGVPSDRSADPREVAIECRRRTGAGVEVVPCLGEAVSLARRWASGGRSRGIFLTGSIYLVGEAMRLLEIDPFP